MGNFLSDQISVNLVASIPLLGAVKLWSFPWEIFQATKFQEKLLSTPTRGYLPGRQMKGDYYLVDLVVQMDLQ